MVKGGKIMGFRAVVVIGDMKGRVGVGCESGREVQTAVKRALVDARKKIVTVPLVRAGTIPHRCVVLCAPLFAWGAALEERAACMCGAGQLPAGGAKLRLCCWLLVRCLGNAHVQQPCVISAHRVLLICLPHLPCCSRCATPYTSPPPTHHNQTPSADPCRTPAVPTLPSKPGSRRGSRARAW